MLKVTIIGADGFVGSAFVRYLRKIGLNPQQITRKNYSDLSGIVSDVVIEAACNSKKFLADKNPLQDFELSVTHRLKTLKNFPAKFHLHISSVDVYDDLSSPQTTKEDCVINLKKTSPYGFNKLLAEQLVQYHAENWLILRLAGMIGDGLRKNPVFDILNDGQIFIHPDSQYQFMQTGDVARIAWNLIERNIKGEIFNLCGDGLISPRQVAEIAGKELLQSDESRNSLPRIVNINNDKIKQFAKVSKTQDAIMEFIKKYTN